MSVAPTLAVVSVAHRAYRRFLDALRPMRRAFEDTQIRTRAVRAVGTGGTGAYLTVRWPGDRGFEDAEV
jgi:hypothetical protein